MSKSFILSMLVIFSAILVFLKYYSQNNLPTNNIGLVDNKKLSKSAENSELKDEAINHYRKKSNAQKNIPLQSTVSQIDVDKLKQDGTTIPIQEISEDLRGNEDENGVRNDINLWINEQDLNNEQKLALTQRARILQNSLIKAEELKKLDVETARHEAEILALSILKSSDCIYKKFNAETNPFKYSDQMEQLILNTQKRIAASEIIDRALSGGGVVYPEGETCEK